MTSLRYPPVIHDIVEEHFDELDFLWEVREANAFASEWTLLDLAEHEGRAEAHLDGLLLAERHGVELAQNRLVSGEISAATAATFVLWLSEDPEARQDVLREFQAGDPRVRQGIRIALRHLESEELHEPLRGMLHATPEVAAAVADVLAFQRVRIPPIDHLLSGEDADVVVVAVGAAGRSGALREEHLVAAMRQEDEGRRAGALRAAALVSLPNLSSMCRGAAASDPAALAFLGVLGDPSDVRRLVDAVREPVRAKAAIAGLGAMGRITGIPLLLELMGDQELGVAAVAAYKRITGATDVEGEKPHPPAEVPEGTDEEEALPPDPARARADWERRAPRVNEQWSYQAGVPIPDGALPAAFDQLPLESRRDVYLRARARARGSVRDVELEAMAARQRSR